MFGAPPSGSICSRVSGAHRASKYNNHSSAHEGHTTQNEKIENERCEDTGAVHDPVFAQVGAERQILHGRAASLRNVAFRSCGDQQGQSDKGGAEPRREQELHRTAAAQGFVTKGVADGKVPLKTQRGHVQDGGVTACLKQEVVDFTGGVSGGGRERKPDSAVELHGHADQQHQ